MNNQSREYLNRLIQDARIVELRHSHAGRWESGLYDDLEHLEDAIRARSTEGNLYTSLNRPSCIRATNRFRARALCDGDIDVITRIVFDLDPKRPTGTASTDFELSAAIAARDLVVRTLNTLGWPMPGLGISGNGAHAVYRTCLESTPAWKQQAAALYVGLRSRLHDQLAELGVDFDITVRNPARIWRCYGTVNRKGDVTTHRPHRRASINLPAGPWQTVKASIVEQTVQSVTPVVIGSPQLARTGSVPTMGFGDYATLDVVAWFAAHGAYCAPLTTSKHAVRCPWLGGHTSASPENGSDSVIWEVTNNWPTFHCSHLHCHGRTKLDVMDLWGDADSYCAQTWRRDHR